MLENAMVVNGGAAFEAYRFGTSETQAAFAEAYDRLVRSTDCLDLSEELSDNDDFLAVFKGGNANAIGRFVLAVMAARNERLAWAEVLA